MIPGILAKGHIVDRPLPSHRSIEAIVSQRIEGLEVHPMPIMRFIFILGEDVWLQPFFIRKGNGQFIQPILEFGRLAALYLRAEGVPEFFASFPTNSISICATWDAQVSTALIIVRLAGSDRSSIAVSGE